MLLDNNNLTTVDATKNKKLTNLDVDENPLLALHVSAEMSPNKVSSLNIVRTNPKQISGGVTNLKSVAPGINLNNIKNVKGGKIDGGSGMVMPDRKDGNVTYDYYFSGVYEPFKASIQFNTGTWFKDVSVYSTPHAMDIQWMGDNNISRGWQTTYDPRKGSSLEFHGMDNVKRQDLAAFLRRLASRRNIANAKYYKPSAADWNMFRDVNRGTPHVEDILWLAKSGITTGWNTARGKEFRGDDTIKRQDMAAFLKRLAAKANKGQSIQGKAFADVNRSTPHWQEIQWLGGSGISTGWPSNRGPVFRGMDTVKRQDMAAFIHRLNNLLG